MSLNTLLSVFYATGIALGCEGIPEVKDKDAGDTGGDADGDTDADGDEKQMFEDPSSLWDTPVYDTLSAFAVPGGADVLIGTWMRNDEYRDTLEFRAGDRARGDLAAWLAEHDLRDAVELVGSKPLILLHAEGD